MAEPIVIASNLVKKFKQFTAVDGISFTIQPGECFGFLATNGAGKTSTIRMIHCVSPVTSGSLTVEGLPASIDNRQIKQMTGVVPQEINLDADLTVYENLLIFSQFFDIPHSVAVKKIQELLDFVELNQKRNNKIDELSTGMKRRLLIARALINRPKMIIADEPTTGLDPQARHLIWQRLRSLKEQGTTLILTTQYMEEAEQICDRIVVMYQGKIIKRGVPSELIRNEIGEEVVEVRLSAEEEARVLARLQGIDFQHERVGDTMYLYSLHEHDIMRRLLDLNLPKALIRPATLEDVFLKLTGRNLIE